MVDKASLLQCKELILIKFKVDDLRHCLQEIKSNTSGKKDELQRRLKSILESAKTQAKAASVILERGGTSGIINNIPRENFIEKSKSVGNATYNINMKKLYFHKNIKNISGWKNIESTTNFPQLSFRLQLPKEDCKSFDIQRTEAPRQCLLLRSTKIYPMDENNKFNDVYPLGMRLLINNLDVSSLLPREICYSSVDKKYRLGIPTILNDGIAKYPSFFKGERSVQVDIRYDRETNKDESFVFAVFVSTQKTVNEVCQEVMCKQKNSSSKLMEELKKSSNSNDVQWESIKISLLSSASLRRIKIPFRGKNCNHLAPDDLQDYVEININTEAWKCKICKAECTPDDMQIEEFYLQILNKHTKADEIELYPNGSFNVLGKRDNDFVFNFPGTAVNNKRKQQDDTIIIIDSDDEEDNGSSIKTEALGQSLLPCPVDSSKVKSNGKVIECITISDSSDDEGMVMPPSKRSRIDSNSSNMNNVISNTKVVERMDLSTEIEKNQPTSHHSCNSPSRSPSNMSISSDSFHNDIIEDINKVSSNILEPSYSNNQFDNIHELNNQIKNNSSVFNKFINGIVDKNAFNINTLIQIKDQTVNNDEYLSKKTLYNNIFGNSLTHNPFPTNVNVNGGSSCVQDFSKYRDDRLNKLSKRLEDIDKEFEHLLPSKF
uniref:SP-RING-type domain-containing protein n=1 Tax=Parastrongyloides trichosuri TaxID=131310 RepID=A0A0N4ZUF5_PARTI